MELTQSEMMRAAMGCRVAAFQAESQSQREMSEGAREGFTEDAREFRELAWKFDHAARSERMNRRPLANP
jgi:hypothetical protein